MYIGRENETGPYLTPYTRVDSSWIKDINIKDKSVETQDDNLKNNFKISGEGKIDKFELTEIQNFFLTKDNLKRFKRSEQTGKWHL